MRRDIDDGHQPEITCHHPKSVASLAREKPRHEKRDLARLRDETEREGPGRLQRRRRGSALLRLDRWHREINRRKLFRAPIQSAPEHEEPALRNKQGAGAPYDPGRVNDAGRDGKNPRPDERTVPYSA